MDEDAIQRARFPDLSSRDLYDILRLRSEVFVVEQACVYLDLDGRDAEDSTVHLWIRDEAGVVGTARVLDPGEPVGAIGRIVTRPDRRSHGVASALVRSAIDLLQERGAETILLKAQAHLSGWYGRFGFEVSGPGYVEDGIPHVPMAKHVT